MARRLVATWTVSPGKDTVEVRRALMFKKHGYTCDCDTTFDAHCACGGRCGCHQDYELTEDGVMLDGEPLPMWLGVPEEVWEYRKKLIGKLLNEGAFAFHGYGKSILVQARFLHAFRALPGDGGEDGQEA